MLTYKINIDDASIKKSEIIPEKILLDEEEEKIIFEFNSSYSHNIEDGQGVIFERGDGETVYISDEYYTSRESEKKFTINSLKDYTIDSFRTEGIENIYCPSNTEYNRALKITFYDDKYHDFFTIRKANVREDLLCPEGVCEEDETIDIPIKNYIYYSKDEHGEYSYYIDEDRRYCVNDYVVSNSLFLLKADGVDSENRYVFSRESLKNTKQTLYFYDENNEKVSFECIVPFSGSGDSRSSLYFLYTVNSEDDENDIVKSIEDGVTLYTENNKYFKKGETIEIVDGGEKKKYIKLIPHKGTKFYSEISDIKLRIPLTEAFETNMLQRETIENEYIINKANELINPIVDMEKQIFVPVITNGNGEIVCDNVKEIFFNLNFLSRNENDVDADDPDMHDKFKHSWKKSSEPLVDAKKKTIRLEDSKIKSWTTSLCPNQKSTHLFDLGYTYEDLKYQKMCVKKSFIRFSYFNKQSRANQALLYYSTIYLDSGEIYGKINKKEKCIDCSVSVCNSFNRTKSSEGYYLYLFPSVLKGVRDEWVTIYMRVDFNHAKYGYTIPMSTPSSEDNKNNGYVNMSGGNYVQEKKNLDNDICFPVMVRYNSEENRYEWCVNNKSNVINNNSNEGTITFNLYEPIVNKQ